MLACLSSLVLCLFFNGDLHHQFRNETQLSISKLLLLSVLKQFFSFIFAGDSKILLDLDRSLIFYCNVEKFRF